MIMTTADRNKRIALKWFEAFNKHDVETLLLLYTDKARHYSPKLKARRPETNGWVTGKDQLREWWNDAIKRLPTLHYELLKLTADEGQVFMEYIRHVEGEEDVRVGEVLEIYNGVIKESRVYHG